MAVTRCVSSHLMTNLLAWRNPQGSEENWMRRYQGIDDELIHLKKTVSTEIGLALLAITSTVETVAYSALAIASLTLYPFTDKPFTFFAKLLQNSSFTIIWSVADAIIYNPFFVNVMTHESFARYWAEQFNPTPIRMLRLDDRLHVSDWERQNREGQVNNALLRPILDEGRAVQALILQGANVIRQDVLANASPETLNLFSEMDPSMYMFVLTKAVYIYTFGAKKNDEIPGFFKPATGDLILSLRQERPNQATTEELQRLITNPDEFETAPQGELAQSIFRRLRSAASEELQDSLLTTRCWQKAAELLLNEGAA